ncbi:hypothetical protein SAMN05518849_114107 [Sphingobium sp. AP50]|nr:hypothetical protein SAMN05518849_114107 [Sphingobium sp. AP50]
MVLVTIYAERAHRAFVRPYAGRRRSSDPLIPVSDLYSRRRLSEQDSAFCMAPGHGASGVASRRRSLAYRLAQQGSHGWHTPGSKMSARDPAIFIAYMMQGGDDASIGDAVQQFGAEITQGREALPTVPRKFQRLSIDFNSVRFARWEGAYFGFALVTCLAVHIAATTASSIVRIPTGHAARRGACARALVTQTSFRDHASQPRV